MLYCGLDLGGGCLLKHLHVHAVNAGIRLRLACVDKILKGANPSELPVERPTKFNLVVNLKTGKQLGITISPSILYRADEVIK